MGLFNPLKKPHSLQDDFFGPLTFMSFKDSTKNYYEGKGKFKPTGEQIEYFIEADLSGPTTEQRYFYGKLQESYDDLASQIGPLIENELRNWNEDFKIRDFRKEFKVVAVTIPRLDSSPSTWDMSFETIHDNNHQIVVEFKDFQPERILIDG